MYSDNPYWCWNKDRPRPEDKYWVQAGWKISENSLLYPFGTARAMTQVMVPPSVAECMFDATDTDPRCYGCKWAKK